MANFTVIGFDDENGQIASHFVSSQSSSKAFYEVAGKHPLMTFVAVLDGHVNEGKGINYPGNSLVDAETVLSQPEVFDVAHEGNSEPFIAQKNTDSI